MPERCPWALSAPELTPYHDSEWGVPLTDDRRMFEFLLLESAQAGLSWLTILKRREGYRRAFADFDPAAVAAFGEADVARLLADPGIIRNKAKVRSAIGNARAFLAVKESHGSFSRYLWGFVDGRPIENAWRTQDQIPAVTPLAEKMSKDLKGRGFTFFGPTIAYAHMQATGLVNDHIVGCFRHAEVAALAANVAAALG